VVDAVTAWVQAMQQPEVPEGAITVKQYRESVGCSNAKANAVLNQWCAEGKWARVTIGNRCHYWPLEMPKGGEG